MKKDKKSLKNKRYVQMENSHHHQHQKNLIPSKKQEQQTTHHHHHSSSQKNIFHESHHALESHRNEGKDSFLEKNDRERDPYYSHASDEYNTNNYENKPHINKKRSSGSKNRKIDHHQYSEENYPI